LYGFDTWSVSHQCSKEIKKANGLNCYNTLEPLVLSNILFFLQSFCPNVAVCYTSIISAAVIVDVSLAFIVQVLIYVYENAVRWCETVEE